MAIGGALTPLGKSKENVGDEIPDFDSWTGGRSIATFGTNSGSIAVPFQTWKKFKEAFAPEIVREAVTESPIPVRGLLDPFGGSGTSALAAQFLGVHPTTVEVNPYLADLIEAKLTRYDVKALRGRLASILERSALSSVGPDRMLPPTFVEPGVKGRYLFSAEIAEAVANLLDAISECDDAAESRFFRVALSGILVDFSNARVNGKGRRYRTNWEKLDHRASSLRSAFADHAAMMIGDVQDFGERKQMGFELIQGDSREVDLGDTEVDLIVFSPPYPNSFDYTDVYNIELWMLGYLSGWSDNGDLRTSTLTSHVQVSREFAAAPVGSNLLQSTVDELRARRDELWDQRLPEMVSAYFADLWKVIDRTSHALRDGGQFWIVVGDSRYSTVDVRVAEILAELAEHDGLTVSALRPFRSMRSSPQQGGRAELKESLIVLKKN